MYRVERRRALIKPWYWELFLSSHGYADGVAWTKRGAERALLRAQAWFLA
jgi:hypothetical protein